VWSLFAVIYRVTNQATRHHFCSSDSTIFVGFVTCYSTLGDHLFPAATATALNSLRHIWETVSSPPEDVAASLSMSRSLRINTQTFYTIIRHLNRTVLALLGKMPPSWYTLIITIIMKHRWQATCNWDVCRCRVCVNFLTSFSSSRMLTCHWTRSFLP